MIDRPTMQAAIQDAHGPPFRVSAISRPVPGKDQVLVRIAASGVNPLDTKIHAGYADHAKQPLPAILGIDLAGAGPGDEVFGMTGGVGGLQGSLAQYAAVDANLLALKPANLSMRGSERATTGFHHRLGGADRSYGGSQGPSRTGAGGAGGVGQMAIQIAVAHGAEVFATGSRSSWEPSSVSGPASSTGPSLWRASSHACGAGVALTSSTTPSAEACWMTPSSPLSVRSRGQFPRVRHATLAPLSFKAASYSGVFTLLPLLTGEGRAHHGDILAEATRLAENGQLLPSLNPRHFTLETVGEGYRAIADRTARGKPSVDV